MSLLVSSLRSVLDSQTCASLIQNLQQQIVSLPFESSELPELIEGFAGLVAYVNPDDWEHSRKSLSARVSTAIEQNELETALTLLQKIPLLRQDFVDQVLTAFVDTITKNETGLWVKINPDFSKPFRDQSQNADEESVKESFSMTLTNLEALYKFIVPLEAEEINSFDSVKLRKGLLLLQCAKNPEISELATKTLGILIKRTNTLDSSLFDLWWNVVVVVCTTLDNVNIDSVNGYIQWLRCINGQVLESSLDKLQIIFDSEQYWDLLIQGLSSKSYDIRKYTLHILAQSLQKIDHNISNNKMYWDTTKTKKLFWEWERYATLVNIVSIDTSIHQAGDSAADIIKLIGKDSMIPKPWARCFLATGLKSSTDSIRGFVGTVALSLTTEDMEIFLDGFEFLTETLLPQLMLASHFAVRRENVDDEYQCAYGDKLSAFVESIIKYLKDDDIASKMIQALLDHLHKERYSFDPARLYVVRGIESGLQGRKVLTATNLETLVHLFHSFAESELRNRIFVFLYFRFFFAISDSVTAEEWFSSLSAACLFQKSVFSEQKDSLASFIKSKSTLVEFFTKSSADTFQKLDTNSAILYLEINHLLTNEYLPEATLKDVDFHLSFISWPNSLINSSQEYQQVFINKFSQIVHQGLNGNFTNTKFSDNVSENWTTLTNSSWFNLPEIDSKLVSNLFEAVKSISISQDSLPEITKYLTLFNICITFSKNKPSTEFSVSGIVDLASKVVKTKVPDRNDMPFKHAALLEIHKTINALLSSNETISSLSQSHIEELFDVLSGNFEFVSFACRLEICESLLKLVNFYGTSENLSNSTLSSSLNNLWSALAVDRLIATERSLHFLFLNITLHSSIIERSIHDEELASTLYDLLDNVVELSYARRCLLPHMTKKLVQYLINTKTTAELPQWMARIQARIFTFSQVDDNLFRLESVVSQFFDAHPFSPFKKCKVSSYIQEYGCQEVDARIYSAFFFGMLDSTSVSHTKFAQELYQYMLHGDDTPYSIFEPRKRNDGLEENERVYALQVLLMLSRFFKEEDAKLVKSNFEELLSLLDTEPSPVARVYIEWILARFNVLVITADVSSSSSVENVVSANKVLLEMDKYDESPRVIGSLERIALLTARILKATDKTVAGPYYKEYISKLVPFSSSNRATVRHYAVSMLIALEGELGNASTSGVNKDNENEFLVQDAQVMNIIKRICDNARASDSFKQHRNGENSIWKPVPDYNLVGICGGVIRKVCDRHIAVIAPEQFNKCSYAELGSPEKWHLQIPAGFTINYDVWKTQEEEEVSDVVSTTNTPSTPSAEPAPLQTKSGFWNAVIDLSLGETGRDSDRVERGELIVVASLVDKAPNLGGICRLCDVLGAKLLCLDDLSVSKNIQFKTVAVTADRWMPMTEVKEGNELIEFMLQKKKEGYTLIGLEQTDKSVELNAELKFPKKSLILLGKEREGIPGEYLAELDTCVEIKQVGVIRSMNIQTATAVIVHAYSVQHC